MTLIDPVEVPKIQGTGDSKTNLFDDQVTRPWWGTNPSSLSNPVKWSRGYEIATLK
jgi:hypothetical protein